MTRRAVHWDCGQRCGTCISVRLWEQVAEAGECWIFTGHLDTKGYGRFRVNGQHEYAHRVSYRLMVGEIPSELHLDHLCRNPRCIRPDHLEVVPPKVNTLRGVSPVAINSRLDSCRAGHRFDASNTLVYRGWRNCRTCRSESTRRLRRAARNALTAGSEANR